MGEAPDCDRAAPVPIATKRLLVRMIVRITMILRSAVERISGGSQHDRAGSLVP